MARDRFMFFENFKTTAALLDDKNKLAFYEAITDYVFNDIEPTDPYIAALLNSIKPSLDKVDGRCRNGGNHNPTGKNQHTAKLVNSGQSRSKLVKSVVNSGQFLSETETETEIKEKEIQKEKEPDTFVAELERQELEKTKKTTKTKKEQPKILYTGKHEYLREQIARWLEYKKSRNEMYKSPQSVLVCVKRLHELCGGDISVAEKIIDQSIGNNWAGLFALKQQPQKAKSISSPDYVGEGSFLRRAEDDPFCADL